MRAVVYQILFASMLALALNTAMFSQVAAEEFRYYVWTDDEGIVHASEEAPKGRDYKVRIIEDVNANVVPADEFNPGSDPPVDRSGETVDGESAAPGSVRDGQSGEPARDSQQDTRADQ